MSVTERMAGDPLNRRSELVLKLKVIQGHIKSKHFKYVNKYDNGKLLSTTKLISRCGIPSIRLLKGQTLDSLKHHFSNNKITPLRDESQNEVRTNNS